MKTFTIGHITFQYYTDSESAEVRGQLWATCKTCGSHERVARAVQHAAVARMWAEDYAYGPYRHTCPHLPEDETMEIFGLKPVEAYRTKGGRLFPRSLVLHRLATARGSALEPTTAWVVTYRGEIVTGLMEREEAEAYLVEMIKSV